MHSLPALPTATEAAARAWTVDDVADFLRVHRRTVIKLAAAGRIPATRIGKLYRFDPQKIVALFDDVAR